MNSEGQAPERTRVVARRGKDDWIGIVYTSQPGDPSEVFEYVRADSNQKQIEQLRAALEAIRDAAQPIIRDPESINTFASWAAQQAVAALTPKEGEANG